MPGKLQSIEDQTEDDTIDVLALEPDPIWVLGSFRDDLGAKCKHYSLGEGGDLFYHLCGR